MIRPFIHKVTEIAVLLILLFAISEEVCDYVKVQFHLTCFMNESFLGFLEQVSAFTKVVQTTIGGDFRDR